MVSFFQDALNVSERLAFAEVTSSGVPLDDDMSNTYELLELKKEDSTSLESYIKAVSYTHLTLPTNREV